jgi:hypothetical protein
MAPLPEGVDKAIMVSLVCILLILKDFVEFLPKIMLFLRVLGFIKAING